MQQFDKSVCVCVCVCVCMRVCMHRCVWVWGQRGRIINYVSDEYYTIEVSDEYYTLADRVYVHTWQVAHHALTGGTPCTGSCVYPASLYSFVNSQTEHSNWQTGGCVCARIHWQTGWYQCVCVHTLADWLIPVCVRVHTLAGWWMCVCVAHTLVGWRAYTGKLHVYIIFKGIHSSPRPQLTYYASGPHIKTKYTPKCRSFLVWQINYNFR